MNHVVPLLLLFALFIATVLFGFVYLSALEYELIWLVSGALIGVLPILFYGHGKLAVIPLCTCIGLAFGAGLQAYPIELQALPLVLAIIVLLACAAHWNGNELCKRRK